jgi:hypothetical protein
MSSAGNALQIGRILRRGDKRDTPWDASFERMMFAQQVSKARILKPLFVRGTRGKDLHVGDTIESIGASCIENTRVARFKNSRVVEKKCFY